MGWLSRLRGQVVAAMEPTWDRVYGDEYTRVREAILEQTADGILHLEIRRLGPDQYCAYYERTFNPDMPISVKLAWWDEYSKRGGRTKV